MPIDILTSLSMPHPSSPCSLCIFELHSGGVATNAAAVVRNMPVLTKDRASEHSYHGMHFGATTQCC